MRRFGCLLAAVCVAASAWLAETAFGGGTQVSVVAVAGRVWVTTGVDVVKLNAFTGRVMRRTKTRYPFPIDIGASDGNIWVSSVENGFVSGALTRIPFENGRVTQALVFPSRPIFALAVGSGTTWALVGPWRSLKLAAVDQATGRTTITPLRTRIAWIGADNAGETPGLFGVTSNGRAVRLGRNGRVVWRAKTDTIQAPPAVGLGGVWVASRTAVYRINAASGRVDAKIRIRGAAAELALGGVFAWMISFRTAETGESYELFKINTHATRVVRHVRVPGPISSISFGNGALWMGRATPTVSLIRIDPRTLHRQLFAKNLS